MLRCNKCSNEFPHWIEIDGKRRNLGKRKYCLDCSPFGQHNTRKLDGTKYSQHRDKRDIEYTVDKNGCHICTSHKKRSDGRYYKIKVNGKTMLLHRYLFEKKNGKISDGLVVRHRCDNELCINVSHMELGTQIDNVRDRVESKGIGSRL